MIICCGDALIDMIERKLNDGSLAYVPVPGGSILNTAVALGRLGGDAGIIAGISSDFFGNLLQKHLTESGVSIESVQISNHPTTLAFVHLKEGEARYSFFDNQSAGRLIDGSNFNGLNPKCSALHFGGISLASEPCGSAYQDLMTQHHRRKVISIDPNIRQSFIGDEERYRLRINSMVEQADIIKVSVEDLEWISGNHNEGRTVDSWLAGAAKLVVVTKGKGGATGFTKSHILEQPAKKVSIVDTVGAGDCFNAGLLIGLSELGLLTKSSLSRISKNELASVLGFASVVAAYVLSQRGAMGPWRNQLADKD